MSRLKKYFSIIIAITLVLGITNLSGLSKSEVKADGAVWVLRNVGHCLVHQFLAVGIGVV